MCPTALEQQITSYKTISTTLEKWQIWKLRKSKTKWPRLSNDRWLCVELFTICDIYALEDIRRFLPNILLRNALQIFYVFSTSIRQISTMISNFIKINIRNRYSAIWVATFVIYICVYYPSILSSDTCSYIASSSSALVPDICPN